MNQSEVVLDIFKNVYEAIPIFQALGDKERLFILLKLVYAGKEGMNVKSLSNNSWLSRPAISHHLKILKSARIISYRKEGTQIYYYFDTSDKLNYAHALVEKMMTHLGQLDMTQIENSKDNAEEVVKKALEMLK